MLQFDHEHVVSYRFMISTYREPGNRNCNVRERVNIVFVTVAILLRVCNFQQDNLIMNTYQVSVVDPATSQSRTIFLYDGIEQNEIRNNFFFRIRYCRLHG